MVVLSCVSIIAESGIIDKVYLIIRIYKVLWSCGSYVLSKLLFKSLCFLRAPIFLKLLYFFARATFSQNAFYLNSYFLSANLVFTVTLFIYLLAIKPNNTRVFRFKLSGDAQNGAPLRKSFH